MLARTGNLSAVYFETNRDKEIRQIETRINAECASAASIDAEIHGDENNEKRADWYLIQTFPGEDLRAMRWLARRRFGVFRPMQQRKDRRNDIAVQGWEPVFAGWLFVFVWDVRKQKSRIRACPGVFDIFCDPVSREPVPIDVCGEDGRPFIEKLRAKAFEYEDNAPRQRRYHQRISTTKRAHAPHTQRPTKQQRKMLDKLKNDLKSRGFDHEHELWTMANGLEPHLRIALLSRTLQSAPPVKG